MSKVSVVIRDALGHLRVLDANEPVEAEDAAEAIRALNLMMRRWEANSIALGWSDVSSPDDDLPAPPEAEEAIGYNLALRLRARYGATLDQDVIDAARDGKAALMGDLALSDGFRLSYDLPRAENELPCGGEGYCG